MKALIFLGVYVYCAWSLCWALVCAYDLHIKEKISAWKTARVLYFNFFFGPLTLIYKIQKGEFPKWFTKKALVLCPLTMPIAVFLTVNHIFAYKLVDLANRNEDFWTHTKDRWDSWMNKSVR